MSARCRWTVGTIGWIVGMGCAGIASAQAPPALVPEPDGVPKNRFISFSFPQSPEGTQWAIRVTLVKMYNTDPEDEDNESCPPRPANLPDLSVFEGQVGWVGAPEEFPDVSIFDDVYTWVGADLQCCPGFRDWGVDMNKFCIPHCIGGACSMTLRPCQSDQDCPQPMCDTSVLNVFAPAIVPCSQYEVQLVDVSCADLEDETCYSDALTIHTAKWGDIWAPLGGSSQPNFTDIGMMVQRFKSVIPPTKVQAMLRGNVIPAKSAINVTDIGRVVDGFKSVAYRQVGPSACIEDCE